MLNWNRVNRGITRGFIQLEQNSVERDKQLSNELNRILRYQTAVEYRLQMSALKDLLSHFYQQSVGYTQLVIAAGYVVFFSMWGSLKRDLPTDSMLWAGLCMTASASIFVLFEVVKMTSFNVHLHKLGQVLQNRDLEDILKLWKDADQTFTQKSFKTWLICLVPTVAFALIALVFLFYNFVNGLAEFYNG